MIEKIIEIQNIGHFVDFKLKGTKEWNGELKKTNIIYAPNGSGKTTLSTILKSLSLNNGSLIDFKKTFGSTSKPRVTIKEKNNSNLVKLTDNTWTSNSFKIEVFDINYIEDYLFAGSYNRRQNKVNLFRLLLGDKGLSLKMKIKPLIHKKKLLHDKNRQHPTDSIVKKNLSQTVLEFEQLLSEFVSYSNEIYDRHIHAVNRYLEKFTTYITLKGFEHDTISDFETFRITPVFKVYDTEVTFSSPNLSKKMGNARYSLSEGDKSTIALCFFLARLEIQGVVDKIIVFDDPLSSFDYARKTTTIFQLAKIATNAIQFVLLTHDLGFAYEFKDKCSFTEYLNLKIENDGSTSYLCHHDIDVEFLTPTQKDIEVLKRSLSTPPSTEFEKREAIRCMRPVLEGVFKTKYFDIIANNIWLGDIIELIKKSDSSSRLNKLNLFIDDIIEINDYTKSFHHATGGMKNEMINNTELSRYLMLLMKIIDRI